MIHLVRWLMILTAIVLSPFYALWVGAGMAADAKERGTFDLFQRWADTTERKRRK